MKPKYLDFGVRKRNKNSYKQIYDVFFEGLITDRRRCPFLRGCGCASVPPAHLKQRVPVSEGTQFYLWLMESVRRVFYDSKLSPLERLSLLGRVV